MTDVQLQLEALGKTASVVDSASKQVKAKQDLLSLLIASEQTRLSVWLHPLENNKKHFFTSGHAKGGLPDVSNIIMWKLDYTNNHRLLYLAT